MDQAFSLSLTPVTWALNLFVDILTSAGAVGAYIAFFFIYTVVRLFIRPLLGASLSFPADAVLESRRKARRDKAKSNQHQEKKKGGNE